MSTPDAAVSDAERHFRLHFFAAVVGLVRQVVGVSGSMKAAVDRFPFLAAYVNELAEFGLEGLDIARAPARFREVVRGWEDQVPGRLPLRALGRGAGLDYVDLVAMAGATLVDEDIRFGALFTGLHGLTDQPRPTGAMIGHWSDLDLRESSSLARIKRLADLGLVEVTNPAAPAAGWCLRLSPLLSLALRGAAAGNLAPGITYHSPAQLPPLSDLQLAEATRARVGRLATIIAEGQLTTLVVRGPRSNGRKTLVSALARERGQGVLMVDLRNGEKAPPALGVLAWLLDAVPIILVEPAPGETVPVPLLTCPPPWRAVVLGPRGACSGLERGGAVPFTLDMPDLATRRALWLARIPGMGIEADAVAERFRMTTGTVVHLAAASATQARLEGREIPTSGDVAQSRELLDRGDLDALAVRIVPSGDWERLVVAPQTRGELRILQQRCLHRESLPAVAGEAAAGRAACGVRALFKGPSGTGKTLAAQLLARELQMELYRVDLSAVVNKYIGETEKQLSRLFDRAEELDAILLFDEGDALLGRRTSVHSATDRYANLETNYLLQRLEAHQGIVIVTTNLSDAIDSAFERRMDAVIDFGPPDAEQRLALWGLHLPPQHQILPDFLEEVAHRCALNGGQIRNAVLHASLLALSQGAPVRAEHATAAVQREYRKSGTACPLRAPAEAFF